MLVIPAIDLRGGKVVRLTKGDYARETVYEVDPATKAEEFVAAGAERLHVIDLDGAKSGQPVNLPVVADLRRRFPRLAIDFGGGIRTAGDAAAAFASGASVIIVGTAAYRDPAFLESLLRQHPDQVALAFDLGRSGLAIEGWQTAAALDPQEAMTGWLRDRKVTEIVYTDTERDGTLAGVDDQHPTFGLLMRRCHEHGIRVQFAGGVRDLGDIERLGAFARLGLVGVVAGKALYEGTLDLGAAIRTARGRPETS